ncbi:hypothetical protein, partial [Bacteroides caecigallinarum]|uniref:hypothetical protein n=1 Tax=Bacteroides caecigallinarum TaxID=1411144 RepID=UPI00195BA416
SEYYRDKERNIFLFYNKNLSVIKKNGIICMFDGNYIHGGLTDRLRGICSIYDFCKEKKVPFYICFTNPFNLKDYLEPYKYDWNINSNDINISNSTIVFVNDWEIPLPLHKYYFKKAVKASKQKQVLIYSNTNFRDYNFHKNFHELFKPSIKLQNEINKIIDDIGDKYITISFRFTTLLGDFKDCINTPLSSEKQEELINDCLKAIEDIYKNTSVNKVVITSDSIKFLERSSNLPFVYIIKGNVGHIDHTNDDNTTLKTFLDYYIISKAQEAYLVIGKGMYKSGFSKHAALMGDTKFIEYYIKY